MSEKIKKPDNSKTVIQLYAKLSDIIRTEYLTTDLHIEEYNKLLANVKKKGIINSLKIKPDGLVLRGNTRCEVAEELDMEYLPIDAGFFAGIHSTDKKNIMVMRKIFYDEEVDSINDTCRPIKKPTTNKYRKKIGRVPSQKDYLINWSDEFIFLESHFETKKELYYFDDLLDHWKRCEESPTTRESCKWCHSLFNIAVDFKEATKDE